MNDMVIHLSETASLHDIRRIMNDLEGFDFDIATAVDLDGTVYVDGVDPKDEARLADFIFRRSEDVILSIMTSTGRQLA